MIIKRPIYDQQLKNVATEVIIKETIDDQMKLEKELVNLIHASDTNQPLFVPYILKPIFELGDHSFENPVIFKVRAKDVGESLPLEEIKESPHSIALLVETPQQLAWLNFAEYIALSEFLMSQADVTRVVEYSKSNHRKVIGYGLLQPQNFDRCKSMSMDFFCGDFIMKPNEQNCDNTASNKLTVIELINRLQQDDVDLNMVIKLIRADPLLSFQVLRVANSVAFSGVQSVDSIDQAVVRLGLKNLKHWVMVLSMNNISSKPIEVVESGLIRATMAKKIAEKQGKIEQKSAYTAGLLSVLDSLLDMPMPKIMEKTALDEDVRAAILDRSGELGELLTSVVAYEEGLWDSLASDQIYGVDLSEIYIESLESVTQEKQTLQGSMKNNE
ncbi:EAL and HDOD domain-containing protein [Legionella sp. W05-934-2]|jgi:c-di-GMP-related signal transduction protein|uniref:EAL and HDOD domain-containing protein n=1 Tax=Legionella sp. W05-934-2 TaxID=1198649 RepID=UPI003463236D